MALKLNWLEQAGLDVAKGLKFVLGTGATTVENVLTAPGTIVSDISKMVSAVKDVEAIGATLVNKTLTGPEKLQAAAIQVQQLVLSTEFLLGKKIANQALFNQAVQEFTQAACDLAQSLEAQPAASAGASAPTPIAAAAPVPAAVPAGGLPED